MRAQGTKKTSPRDLLEASPESLFFWWPIAAEHSQVVAQGDG